MNILLSILVGLQVFSALALIALVLLHSPKAEGLGGLGSASQLFTTARGAEEGLNNITFWVLGTFLLIAFITGHYGHYLLQQ